MTTNAWDRRDADIPLHAGGHGPQDIVAVKDIDIFIDQNDIFQLGIGRQRQQRGLYSNIYKGEMVPSFEDWCFDPARQSGDTGIVESSNGYHVMYFVETNPQPYWYYKADLDLKNDAYDEWYAAITDGVETEQLDGMKYVG